MNIFTSILAQGALAVLTGQTTLKVGGEKGVTLDFVLNTGSQPIHPTPLAIVQAAFTYRNGGSFVQSGLVGVKISSTSAATTEVPS